MATPPGLRMAAALQVFGLALWSVMLLPGCRCASQESPAKVPAPPADADPETEPPAPAGTEADPGDRAVPAISAPATRRPAPSRMVAIGDVHGDLGATRAALRLAGAIDDADRWVGGRLVVVQTGDQLDRGDEEVAVLELLSRLRTQAEQAGGALYVLNGNHEIMNVAGDFRYVPKAGFERFARIETLDLDDPALAELPVWARGRAAAFRPGMPYARRLATRNVVMVVGDTVFVHGGVLPEHVAYGVERINREVQAWMSGVNENPEVLSMIMAPDSPVWTRAYSADTGPEDCAELGQVLSALQARRMVVGHTVQKQGISSACDGRVWRIDVGMAEHYGGQPQVLEITAAGPRILGPPEPAAESVTAR